MGRFLDLSVFAVSLAMMLGLFSAASPNYFSNDAAQNVSTADQLLRGRGLQTTTLFFDVQQLSGLPSPQTAWPPGLASLTAGVALATGLDTTRALSLVNAFAHGTSSLLLYWLLAQLLDRRWIAAFISLGYLGYWFAWVLALVGQSEPLYTLSLLAVTAGLTRGFPDERSVSSRWLGGCSILACLPFVFRYQGVVMVASLTATMFFGLLGRARPMIAICFSLLTTLPTCVTVLAVFAHNFAATGRIAGAPSWVAQPGLSQMVSQAAMAIKGLTGIGYSTVTTVAGIAAATSIVVAYGAKYPLRQPIAKEQLLVATFCLLTTILTVGLIVGLAGASAMYVIEDRYFLSFIPLLIVAVAALWPRDGTADRSTRVRRAAVSVSVLATVALLGATASGALNFMAQPFVPEKLRHALSSRWGSETVLEMLVRETSESSPVMSNWSQMLHLVLRRPTIGPPTKLYSRRAWSARDVVELAQRFGVRYLCVFRQLPEGASDGSDDYVWQVTGNEPGSLELLLMTDSLALYRVANSPAKEIAR